MNNIIMISFCDWIQIHNDINLLVYAYKSAYLYLYHIFDDDECCEYHK